MTASTDSWFLISTAVIGLLFLLFAYYAVIFIKFIRRVKEIGEAADKFPGACKHWLWGTLHLMPGVGEDGISYMMKLTEKFPRIYRSWLGPLRASLTAVHPETVRAILKSTEAKQLGIGPYGMLKSWLGDGLLLSSGEKWQRNRRLLTPAFHFDVLKPYIRISNNAADTLLSMLEESSRTGESVDICRPVGLCTLDVILRCAFSYEENVQQEGESHPYVNSILTMAKLLVERFFKPHHHFDAIYRLSANGRHYQAKKKSSETIPGTKHPDFLDILLLAKDEEGKGLTYTEICDEVDTFLFEGHDTTASAISWILFELAKHPSHQKECRQELDSLLKGRACNDILWDDLAEIPYLTVCIKEAMILNAPVPFIGRDTLNAFELEGIRIPEGSNLGIGIHLLHTNKAVWGQDALEFKPERFHHENMKTMDPYSFLPFSAGSRLGDSRGLGGDNTDPYSFLPFSAGSRNCIGQNFAMHEIKVVVAKVVHRFELRLDPAHKVERMLELVMRAQTGIGIFLKERT